MVWHMQTISANAPRPLRRFGQSDRYGMFVSFTTEFDHVKLLAGKYCVNIHFTTNRPDTHNLLQSARSRSLPRSPKRAHTHTHILCVKQNTSSSMQLDTFMINESTSAQCIFHEYWTCYIIHTHTHTPTYMSCLGGLLAATHPFIGIIRNTHVHGTWHFQLPHTHSHMFVSKMGICIKFTLWNMCIYRWI